jgi:hypothetical protein
LRGIGAVGQNAEKRQRRACGEGKASGDRSGHIGFLSFVFLNRQKSGSFLKKRTKKLLLIIRGG